MLKNPHADYVATISVAEIVDELFSELPHLRGKPSRQSGISGEIRNAAATYLRSSLEQDEVLASQNSSSTAQGTVEEIIGYYASGVMALCEIQHFSNRGLPDEVAIRLYSNKPLDLFVDEMTASLRQACRAYVCQAKEKMEQ